MEGPGTRLLGAVLVAVIWGMIGLMMWNRMAYLIIAPGRLP
ncbi:hypothetical protein GCM10011273_00040 [Asticcacaulis endophyticus]|uniref:Uncharacterized protein n=1 Tax=Asticcacaulis endophyticus TaxID=1395890 RepID=A0A918PS69_9CAUL|nr:hypothetical protein GCM10011273_00040 [Asticcacaulis endophyticus]